MRGTEVYRLLGGMASESTAKMNTTFLKHYDEGLNEMFARLHASQHHAAGSAAYTAEYNGYLSRFHQSTMHTSDVHIKTGSEPLEYDRYKFRRRSEANLFIAEMRKQGVEVTIAPFRQHQQILIEIPKKIPVLDADGNEKLDANGKPVTIRTAQYAEAFTASTGIEAQRYTYFEDYGDAQQPYTQGTTASAGYGIVRSELLNNMGELGGLIRFAGEMSQLSVRHGDTDQKHAFTSATRHDGAGESVGGHWSGNTRPDLTKTAFVYNGQQEKVTVTEKKREKYKTEDGKTKWRTVEKEVEKMVQTGVVIIDGREVTETDIGAMILGRQQRREQLADRYISQYGKAQQAFGSVTGSTYGKVGHAVGLHDGDAKRTLFRTSESNERIAANARDIKLSIKKQSYASGIEKHGRYDDGADKGGIGAVRNSFGTQAIMLKKFAGEVEITEEMMALMQKAKLAGALNATQTEFVDEFAQRLSENGSRIMALSFDDKINIINTVKAAQAYHGKHSNLTAAEVTLADEMNKYAEDGGLFRLSKAEAVMFGDLNSPNSVKNQLDALKQDLDVQLHFSRQLGNNLSKLQLRQVNTELEGLLAGIGVTYDETAGKFRNATGSPLTERQLRDKIREAGGNGYANKFDTMLTRAGVGFSKDGRLVHTHGSDITEWDILKIDKAFLTKAAERGFNFVTAAGTLDVESLQQLLKNPAALKRLGMSEATVRAMLRFHEKDGSALAQFNKRGAASWGNSAHKLRGEIGKRGVGGVSKLAGGGSKLVGEGDEETAQAVQSFNTMARMPNHIKQTAAYVKQFSDGVNQRVDWVKQRLGTNSASTHGRTAKPKSAKQKAVKAENRKVNAANIQKKLDRDEKRLARMKASEARLTKYQNIIHKFDLKDRAIEWVSTKTAIGRAVTKLSAAAKGLIMKAVGAFLGGYAVVSAVAIVIAIFCCVIQALVNLPYEGFKKLVSLVTDDTPAITVLYRYMDDDLQDDWLDGLNDYDKMRQNRTDIRYGLAYDDFATYVSTLNGIEASGSDYYINPFYKVGNNVPTENKTPISAYDGKNDSQLVANPSVYGDKTDGTSTESGHTNNLKDILAMTDVMYQFDLNRSDDDSLHGILDEPPAIINFEHFWSEVFGRLKWAGKCVLHFFGLDGEEDYPDPDDYWGGTVSYLTIQNYVTNLWTASHQEQIVLEPEFYSMSGFTANIEGTETDISSYLSQENASYLGICNSPVTSSFKIAYDGSHIYPYLLNDSGLKVDLSSSSNTADSHIRLLCNTICNTGHYAEGENPCLWDGMASDEPTFNAINARVEAWGDDCWDRRDPTEDYESYTATSDWYDNIHDAKNDAKAKVQARSNEIAADGSALAVDEPYQLSADRNFFIRTWKEACNRHGTQVGDAQTRQVENGTETKPKRWTGTDSSSFGGGIVNSTDSGAYPREVWIVKITNSSGSVVASGYCDETTNGSFEDRGGEDTYDWWYKYTTDNGADTHSLHLGSGEFTSSFEQQTYEQTVYKTQYKVTWKADVCCKYTQVYERDCNGHDFVYCGGHVACHVKGCVYSCTNEQLALAGTQVDDSVVPKAKYCTDGITEYSLADNGFAQILGKIDKHEVNYAGSPAEASTTGGCESAAVNIQGSDVVRGLNIWVEGGSLQKDMTVRTDVSPQVYRDIFDVDMAIDKGDNVFPWGAVAEAGWRKYEGWTADNMAFVAMRTSVDWNDIYGFDIPLEIGAVSLSEDDINLILEGLKAEYGSHFSESREDAVQFALRWVGRGHYSKNHTDHDFLDKLCQGHAMSHIYNGVTYTTSYDACCSAGNSRGFVNFYLSHFDKNKVGSIAPYSWYNMGGVGSLYPADVVRHTPVYGAYLGYSFSWSDLTNGGGTALRRGLEEVKDRDAYAIFIGVLNHSIFDDAGSDEIELSNGYIIRRGVPITVDLSPAPEEGLFSMGTNGSGSVFFRSENSSGYGEAKCTENFYWFLNPDSNTQYIRFE